MASTGGLTRRRGAGGGAGPSGSTADAEDGNRVSSPIPGKGKDDSGRAPETSYTGGENGHKIAFDPRDISESEERSKAPKLTLMEEVLLMGLKDKQVRQSRLYIKIQLALLQTSSDKRLCYRDISHSGTTISLTPYEAA